MCVCKSIYIYAYVDMFKFLKNVFLKHELGHFGHYLGGSWGLRLRTGSTRVTFPETKPASLHLKMDGWNTILSYWEKPIFQVRYAVSFREGT